MVYLPELAVGAGLLVVGYLLHTNHQVIDSFNRKTKSVGTTLSPRDFEIGRRSVVVEQAAGGCLFLLGLVLTIDGLGL